MSIVVVTATDASFFHLAQGTIQSLRSKPQGQEVALALLDLGCSDEQRQWFQQRRVDLICQPDWHYPFPETAKIPFYFRGLLARPFLRHYFPGFEVYLWIDADAWLQDWNAVELFVRGARKRGLAIVSEVFRGNSSRLGDSAGRQEELAKWYGSHYGPVIGRKMASYPMLNAGVFALGADAPHWELWDECLRIGLKTSCSNFADQLALNLVVYHRGLLAQTELLPAWCNWMCHCGLPAWDPQTQQLVDPYLPHTPIGIFHLSGEKRLHAPLQTTSGPDQTISLRYQAGQEQSDKTTPHIPTSASVRHDYIAPGLERIHLDGCFPNMVVDDPTVCPWHYLRQEIPHLWYRDHRTPLVGFVSRDEAHILYNSARQFQGRAALEIGCWVGWSACHLARARVLLDVIDPLLERPDFHSTVVASLSSAGVFDNVNLVSGLSPQQVHDLAQQKQRRWSLLFIDGNHDAPFPLNDTIACEPYAEDDAMILFHDLASPEVSQGLDYLQERGWKTMVYQTMQVMGVAWRGNVEPVRHYPDPSIHWPWPVHLRRHPVSDWSQDFDPDQARAEFFRLYEAVRPFTRLGDRSLTSLYTLARTICSLDLPGNFVECGTVHGGAAAVLAYVIKTYSKRSRQVYFCEPFQGETARADVDRHQDAGASGISLGADADKAWLDDGLEEICRQLNIGDMLIPLKNLFADSLSRIQTEIGPVALLYVDGGGYGPTMNIFDHLFDQISPGGMIQIADYGHSEGCKSAVDDFQHYRGVRFDFNSTDFSGVWMRKD